MYLFLRINCTLADIYLYFSNRPPQSTAKQWQYSLLRHETTHVALYRTKCLEKTHPILFDTLPKGKPLTSNTKSHILFTKRKQKRTQSKWLSCWQVSCSVSTTYTQLTKPTGYSGGLGQAFNILLLAISTVGSSVTDWIEESDLWI